MTKIEQANAGAVTTGTPAIDYTYADGAVETAAKYLRLTSVTYPGPATRRPVHYNYPASGTVGAMLNRLDNMDDGVAAPDTVTYARYSYLGASTIVKVEHPATSDGTDAGLTLSYDPDENHSYSAWDRFGRVLEQTWKPVSGQAYDRHMYTYDRSGNRLTRQTEGQALLSQEYSYDGLNRLTEFHRGHTDANGQIPVTSDPETEIFRTAGQTWSLDQLGNWATFRMDANGDGVYTGSSDLSQSRTHNLVNEIDNDNDHTNAPDTGTITQTSGQAVWLEPKYDAAGNMIEGPSGLDPAVRIKLIYDAWNRLVKVTDSSETPVTIAVYRYDGQNHRIRKLVHGGGNSWTATEYYYNAAWQVLEERTAATTWDESGGGPGAVTAMGPQYLWDIRYIDAPVCRFLDVGPGTETVFFCTDANMNVTALVGAYLQPGTQGPHYEYDPYGKVHVYNVGFEYQGNDPGTTEILYCGYRYDPETGLYHVRNRMYQPLLGRWMQRDPAQYSDSMNIYQNTHGNPFIGTDPFGLWTFARNGGAWATATSMPNDTLRTLAKQLYLDPKEIPLWAMGTVQVSDDSDGATTWYIHNWSPEMITDSVLDTPLCPGQKLATPNTVVFFYGSRHTWEWQGMAIIDIFQSGLKTTAPKLRAKGFRVEEIFSSWRSAGREAFISSWTTNGIYALGYAGHGSKAGLVPVLGWPLLSNNDRRVEEVGVWDVYPPYKLSALMLLACYSADDVMKLTGNTADGEFTYTTDRWDRRVYDKSRFTGFHGEVSTASFMMNPWTFPWRQVDNVRY